MKRSLLWEEYLLAAILVVQTVLVAAGVLSRYVFSWSLSFTEELTRYLLAWLACMGFSACWARGEAIGFRWPGRKPPWFAAVLRTIPSLATAVFFLIIFYSSCKMIQLQWKYSQATSVMGWPIVWVSAALPAGCALLFYRMAARWNLRGKNLDEAL